MLTSTLSRLVVCLVLLIVSFSYASAQTTIERCAQEECTPRLYPSQLIGGGSCDLIFPVHFWIITDANGQNGIHQIPEFGGDIAALVDDRYDLLVNAFSFSQMAEEDHFNSEWDTDNPFPSDEDFSFEIAGIDIIESNDLYYSETTNGIGALSDELLALCIDHGYNCDAINIYLNGPNAEVRGGRATNLDGLATRAAVYIGGSNAENDPMASSSVLVHELGHLFGLYHVFHSTAFFDGETFNVREPDPVAPPLPQLLSEQNPYGQNGETTGDFILDTYPAPLLTVNGISVCLWDVDLEESPNYHFMPGGGNWGLDYDLQNAYQTFPAFGVFDPNTTIADDELPVANPQISNFMGYYPVNCLSTFTPGQSVRMINHARTTNLLNRISCGLPEPLITAASCDDSDGEVTFQFPLGIDLSSITVNGNALDENGAVTFTGLFSGNHEFTIEGHGCDEVIVVFIPADTGNLVDTPVAVTHAECAEDSGVIIAPVNGVDPNISWLDENDVEINTSSNLVAPPGLYTLIVTEGTSCFQEQFEIGVDNEFVIVATQSTVNCSTVPVTGSQCFFVEHLSGLDDYTWDLSFDEQGIIESFMETCAGGLIEGDQQIVVSNGICSQQFDFSISEEDIFDISAAITNAQCIGEGAICASMIGYETSAFTYSLEPSNLQNVSTSQSIICIDNLEVGPYSLSVSDVSECSQVVDFSIENLVAAEIDIDNPGCNLEFGTALVQFSCGISPFSISVVSITDPDEFAPLVVQDILDPSYLISNLDEGIYNVGVSNASDEIFYTFEIETGFGPDVEFDPGNCPVGLNNNPVAPSIIVNGNNAPFVVEIELLIGGYSETIILDQPQYDDTYIYQIPFNDLPFGNNTAGLQFYVHVTDDTGCEETIIGEVPSDWNFTLLPSEYCSNNGDLCFEVNTGNNTLVFVNGLPLQAINQNENTFCIISNLVPEGFDLFDTFVTVSDPNECDANFSLSPFNVLWNAEATCETPDGQLLEIIIIGPSGSYAYDINSGAYEGPIIIGPDEDYTTLQLPVILGSFELVVEDENSCSIELESGNLGLGFAASQSPICFEGVGQIEIESVNGFSGNYNVFLDGALVNSPIPILDAGTYIVTVQDAENQNCQASQPFTFAAPIQLSTTLVSLVNETCDGQNDGLIEILVNGGSGNYSYSWTGPNGTIATNDFTIVNLHAGMYYVGVTDLDNGCYIPGQFEVTSSGACCPNTLSLFPNIDYPTCPGRDDGSFEFSVDGLYPPFNVNWEASELIPFDGVFELEDFPIEATDLESLVYNVTIVDNLGCTLETNVDLTVPFEDAPANPISNTADATLFDDLDCTSSIDLQVSCALCGVSGMDLYMPPNTQITILEGANFTLNNCDLLMGEGAEIIVEEGATLSLNDCNLTACDDNWLGIDVRADYQTGTSSGVLNISGGTIRYAENAIETGDASYDPLVFNYNLLEGGQINCDDFLVFENNQHDFKATGVTLYPDEQSEQFSFINCTFRVDDEFTVRFEGNPEQRVSLTDVRGYGFDNCHFENVDSYTYNWYQRGNAIEGFNAKTDILNSTFTGFQEAVCFSVVHNHFNFLDVEFCTFSQNKTAIRNVGLCFQELIGNDIEVDDDLTEFELFVEADFKEGIFIDGGQQFNITDNHINGHNFVSGSEYTYGIRIHDTGTPGSTFECYENYLYDLNFGNCAEGNNTEGELNGLRYLCNRHFSCENDIYISGVDDIAIGAEQNVIAPNEQIQDAGNWFSDSFPGQNDISGHLHNDGVEVDYFYTLVAADQATEQPDHWTDNTVDIIVSEDNNECDDYEPQIIDENEEIILTALTEYVDQSISDHNEWVAVKFLYISLIDDGDTQTLKDEIDGAWSEDTWVMREQMLARSPHLSIDVLYSIADRTDVFPHPVALEIIVANPDAIRDIRFMDYLATKPDPMPDSMIEIIWASRDQETLRTEIEHDLVRTRQQYIQTVSAIIHAIDSDILTYESLYLSLIDDLDNLRLEFGLAELEISNGDLSGAQDRVDAIPAQIRLSQSMQREYNQFVLWLDLRLEMASQGKSWSGLSQSQLDDLYNLVDVYDTWTGRAAMSVLNHYYQEEYYVPPLHNSPNWSPRNVQLINNVISELDVSIFPNPADTKLNIKMHMNGERDIAADLKFYDLSGQIVHQVNSLTNESPSVIDIREWVPGLYIWRIQGDDGIFESGKIEIAH